MHTCFGDGQSHPLAPETRDGSVVRLHSVVDQPYDRWSSPVTPRQAPRHPQL